MSAVVINRFQARRSPVTAGQVTSRNLVAVADWTGGVAHIHKVNSSVSIPPDNTPAMVTDWVLRTLSGEFSVLTDEAFRDRYERSSSAVRVP